LGSKRRPVIDAGGIFAYARQTGMIAGWYEQKIDEPPQVE